MTPLAIPAATSIGRLRLRGDAHAIAAARAPLAAALQQVSWPVTPASEILILRRVCARGQARELAARAAAAAHDQAAHAVNGWSPGASSADAVRFSSRASLLACLVRDLLQGTAGRHWYWQAWPTLWQAPGAAALTRLLLEEPLALPTIIDTLHESQVGPRFWATIGHDGAAEILAQVARVAGWHERVEAARRRLDTPSPPATAVALPTHAASWQRPRHDLRFLAADVRDARLLLAALLTLWQVAPRQLQSMASVETLCALVQANRGTAAPHARAAPQAAAAAPAPTPAAAPPQAPARTTPAAPAASTSASTPGPDLAASTRGPRQRSGETGVTAASTSAPALATGSPTAAKPGAAAAPHPATQRSIRAGPMAASRDINTAGIADRPDVPIGHRFLTGQGGLFYLLNFLALPAVQAKLPPGIPGSGWRGLYELALAFDCAPHAALLEFLAQACSAESGEALQALPPCVDSAALLRLGAQRYGAEVWRAESWQLPARVVATASHLDVHFRLQDASIAVRRSGLDLNPGWLPWLGRVVTFHYGSGLEP